MTPNDTQEQACSEAFEVEFKRIHKTEPVLPQDKQDFTWFYKGWKARGKHNGK